MKYLELFERSTPHNNIAKLADLILIEIANRTIKYDKWSKDKEIYPNNEHSLMDSILPIVIKNIDVRGKGFDQDFRNFIKNKKTWFRVSTEIASEKSNTKGEYRPDTHKNTSIEQVEIVLYYPYNDIEKYFNSLNNDIGNMNYWNSVDFLKLRKNTLEHELQHAYDDYRSKGKFLKNIVKLPNINDPNYTKKHKEYANTEHEISAFFTNTASKILEYSYKPKDLWSSYNPSKWSNVINAFKNEFPHWNSVDFKTQKKLIARLAIIWSNKFKKELESRDITDKVKKLQNNLREKYNTNDIIIWYTDDNNYIQIQELKVGSTENEKAVIKEIIKLADTYRKTIGMDVYKNHTAKYVMKSRKFLKELGFKKNYRPKYDYKFREDWIRYSKRK